MHSWIKGSFLSALAFGGSWSGAVWFWRSTNRMPSTGELAAYLIILPLTLLLGYWLLRKSVAAWSARSSAVSTSGGTGAASAAGAEGPVASAEASSVTHATALHIVAAGLRVPHGASIAALSEALTANKAHPDLDKALYDEDGYPVMSARAAGVDEAAAEQSFNLWLGAAGKPVLHAREEFWRAIALAEPVIQELAQAAAAHPQLPEAAAFQQSGTPAQLTHAMNAVPMLQLSAVLPQAWHSTWRDAAGNWLRHQLVQAGWPEERILLHARTDRTPGAIIAELQQSQGACMALLLACGSNLGSATVDNWAMSGTLFTSARPQGLMPGEGAAGLLLADKTQAALLGAEPHPLLAAMAEDSHREDTAKGRSTDSALLNGLVHKALKPLANVQAAATTDAVSLTSAPPVSLIVADTGHRSTRVLELMSTCHALQPQLDPVQDVLALGKATGSVGHAGFVAALALAAAEVKTRNEPVLCIANEDPTLRCAALIRPATPA